MPSGHWGTPSLYIRVAGNAKSTSLPAGRGPFTLPSQPEGGATMCLDPISRRRFLQFTATGVAASTSVAQAQTAAPARPQDQMTAGMIDFHVHTYPDNFDRTVSAADAARGAAERGLKAIVLKGGAFETVTRAAQDNAAVPGIKIGRASCRERV